MQKPIFFETLTEDELMREVTRSKTVISFIKNPSIKVQQASVRFFPSSIQYIQDPCELIQLEAVLEDPSAIKYIKNPTQKVMIHAVQNYGHALMSISDPSYKVQFEAVSAYPRSLIYIKDPSKRLISKAIKLGYWEYVVKVKNPSEKLLEESIHSSDGRILRYKLKMPERLLAKALKLNPDGIMHIEDPSEKLQMLAVKTYPRVFEYINSPTVKVQRYMVKVWTSLSAFYTDKFSDLHSLKRLLKLKPYTYADVKFKSKEIEEEIQLYLVRQNGHNLKYFYDTGRKLLSQKVKKEAIKNNPYSIQYIKCGETFELAKLAFKLDPLVAMYFDIPKILNNIKISDEEKIMYRLIWEKFQNSFPN